MQQFVSDMEKDENYITQAKNNSKEHFKFLLNDAFMGVVVDRMMQNKEFCERVLDDEKFGDTVVTKIRKEPLVFRCLVYFGKNQQNKGENCFPLRHKN